MGIMLKSNQLIVLRHLMDGRARTLAELVAELAATGIKRDGIKRVLGPSGSGGVRGFLLEQDGDHYRINEAGRRTVTFITNSEPNEHGFMIVQSSDNGWQISDRAAFTRWLAGQGFVLTGSDGVEKWERASSDEQAWIYNYSTGHVETRGKRARHVRELLNGLIRPSRNEALP